MIAPHGSSAGQLLEPAGHAALDTPDRDQTPHRSGGLAKPPPGLAEESGEEPMPVETAGCRWRGSRAKQSRDSLLRLVCLEPVVGEPGEGGRSGRPIRRQQGEADQPSRLCPVHYGETRHR